MVVFLPTVALARGFRCFLFFVGRFFEEEKETTLERRRDIALLIVNKWSRNITEKVEK